MDNPPVNDADRLYREAVQQEREDRLRRMRDKKQSPTTLTGMAGVSFGEPLTMAGPRPANDPVSSQLATTFQALHPFHLMDASNEGDGALARVIYGTVNDIPPIGMSTGDDPPFYVAVSDGAVIYLHVTTDSDGVATGVAIATGGSVPSDGDTDFYLLIGSVAVDSGGDVPIVTCADNLTGSQVFSRCRNWFSNPATYTADWSVV